MGVVKPFYALRRFWVTLSHLEAFSGLFLPNITNYSAYEITKES
jgi:hypothetical protein